MVRPILFNGEMVRAILEGRKTVTRRAIKDTDESMYAGMCGLGPGLFDRNTGLRVKEPYYRLGDILYVRETWNQLARVDENGYTHYNDLFYVYKADKNQPDLYDDNGFYLDDTERKWRPSIHMPKEATRIWLQVTDVRAERLHNLTNRDAKKEGVTVETDNSGIAHRAAFMRLWDSTIKKSDIGTYGWDANPWVWVIEFERCEKPEEAEE
ncbi:hypothetical protein [Enterocloster citroniae]|uniref:hypothetical protein n=1 Tax=Enterocloster citroniae TaxID=358743 RepID=UPI002E7993E6|nr:hypothetical protein [Enterocloster citroniae]